MTEARKLTAIMAIDVVGYSRLMGDDEPGTARAVREHRDAIRPLVAERAGRIVKTMGDGLLLEFPSVVDAVECAIAIQKLMFERNAASSDAKRIVYRIGVHLGDVLIEGDDILGESVNIAARLEGLCEPGGVLVSGSAHEHVRGRIATGFVDLGDKNLKNIAIPVRAYALSATAFTKLPRAKLAQTIQHPPGKAIWIGTMAGCVALLAAVAWWLWANNRIADIPNTLTSRFSWSRAPVGAPNVVQAPGTPRLSMVVLPFSNLSKEPDQEYFADGITEDLTTDLSRILGSFVIARNTAFTYKGKAVDIKQIGRELGVRYAVEGSVRRIGEEVRINVQLIDAETGAHIWADRIDGVVAQLPKVQDEITRRLARSLNVALVDAESSRAIRERPQNPDAVDLTMRGMTILHRPASRDTNRQARELFEQALRLSPDHLQAHIGLAGAMAEEVASTWYSTTADLNETMKLREDRLRSLELLIARGLLIDPDNAQLIYYRGWTALRLRRDLEEASTAYNRAVALDSNLASAFAGIAAVKIYGGRSAEAHDPLMHAIRLSPRDPTLASRYFQLATACIHLERYDDAVEWGRKSVDANPSLRFTYRVFAAALALAGKQDEALRVTKEYLRRYPNETIRLFVAREPWKAPAYLIGQEREIRGMRLAGIPE